MTIFRSNVNGLKEKRLLMDGLSVNKNLFNGFYPNLGNMRLFPSALGGMIPLL